MAPETLSSQTYPASDVWAAGVMAYQLLSGALRSLPACTAPLPCKLAA
jgi:serine/threonine protein kinase